MCEQPLGWDAVTSWIDELELILAARREPELIRHIQKLGARVQAGRKVRAESTEKTL